MQKKMGVKNDKLLYLIIYSIHPPPPPPPPLSPPPPTHLPRFRLDGMNRIRPISVIL